MTSSAEEDRSGSQTGSQAQPAVHASLAPAAAAEAAVPPGPALQGAGEAAAPLGLAKRVGKKPKKFQ